MANTKAFNDFLHAAVAITAVNTPDWLEYYDAATQEIKFEDPNRFMDTLAERFVENKLLAPDASTANDKVAVTRAAGFALKTVNSIYAAERIKENIDVIFGREENIAKLEAQGYSTEEQKNALKNQIKDYVDEKLGLNPKRVETKQFVEKMKERYHEYERDYKDVDNDLFLTESCAFIYSLTGKLAEKNSAAEALAEAQKEASESRMVSYVSTDLALGIGKLSPVLKNEMEILPENVQEFRAYFGNGIKVKPSEFLEHAKTGDFTNEDKIWASEVYNSMCNNIIVSMAVEGSNIDMVDPIKPKDFMLDGKPLFNEGKYGKGNLPIDFVCDVVQHALNGDNISVVNPETQKNIVLQPKFCENPEPKSVWQKIREFIEGLLGIDEKSKVAEIENKIEEKSEKNKAVRDKISFNELVGNNDITKLAPTKYAHENTKDLSKKTPSLGL